MNAIETYDLSKQYGAITAVDAANLVVPAQTIFGVVGARGAGKTTLLRLLATLTMPSGGDALVAGSLITGSPLRVRRNIGFMPAQLGVYTAMTLDEYLRFFAGSYGIPRADHTNLVSDLLQLVDLYHRRADPVTQITPSMRQRLSLARALVHDPQVLLLDEPVAQLDPRTHVEMRELIKELRTMGKTIVLSASLVADLTGMCTDIAIMDRGRIVIAGTAQAVQDHLQHQRTIAIKFFGSLNLALNIAEATDGAISLQVISSDTPSTPDAEDTKQTPAVLTTLKEIRVGFNGQYRSASEMLSKMMRGGVQVVAFSELEDTSNSLLIRAAMETDKSAAEMRS